MVKVTEGKKMNAVFSNRRDAGQKLAQKLIAYTNKSDVIVLALPPWWRTCC
jgi:hypothetical protein